MPAREPGKHSGEVSEGRPASQPPSSDPGIRHYVNKPTPSNFVRENKSMLTTSVKVHLAGEDVVALCDTGSGGMSMGVSLINEDVCSRWRRKLGRRITPNTRKLTTVAGQTLDTLGEIVVDFVLNGELIQQEMLVLRGMTEQMILVCDFCLLHRAVVDTRAGILRFNSGSAPLLSREELAPELGMVRLHDQTQIPARSEKLVVGQIDSAVEWQYNVLVTLKMCLLMKMDWQLQELYQQWKRDVVQCKLLM